MTGDASQVIFEQKIAFETVIVLCSGNACSRYKTRPQQRPMQDKPEVQLSTSDSHPDEQHRAFSGAKQTMNVFFWCFGILVGRNLCRFVPHLVSAQRAFLDIISQEAASQMILSNIQALLRSNLFSDKTTLP